MKILMPVIQHEGKNVSLDSDTILGGVEMFQKLVYKNIDNVIPVYISYEDRMNRNVSSVMQRAVNEHNPDIIFTNHFNATYTVGFQKYDLPVVWLNHSPGIRSIYNVESVKAMKEFTDNQGSIYFVSEDQKSKFDAISERILGHKVEKVRGYVNSCFSDGLEEVSNNKRYDAITVGRSDPTKNPFFLHKKVNGSDLTTCVLTSDPLFQSIQQLEYARHNERWGCPRFTVKNSDHKTTMSMLATGKVYVSTCPVESWGITALEALTRGLPLILVTDSTGTHGSQCVADRETDYRMVSTSVSTEELCSVINELKDLTYEQRCDISYRTKQKHSKDNWVANLNKMFADSYSRYSSNSLSGLF